MNPAIHIGATDKTVSEAGAIIIKILDHRRPDDVVLEALKAFTRICNVDGTTITNCNFTQAEPKKKSKS